LKRKFFLILTFIPVSCWGQGETVLIRTLFPEVERDPELRGTGLGRKVRAGWDLL
jgi:hypothetical protein